MVCKCRYLNSSACRVKAHTSAQHSAPHARFLFTTQLALQLASARGMTRAARCLFSALGRFSDALEATSTLDESAAVIDGAPRGMRRALWLQVLQRHLATVPVAAGGAEAIEQEVAKVLQHCRGELQLADALEHVPRADGAVAAEANLLRRAAAAEAAQLEESARGFEGLGGRIERRRAQLRTLHANRRVNAKNVMQDENAVCGACGKLLTGVPGKAVPHGTLLHLDKLVRDRCNNLM